MLKVVLIVNTCKITLDLSNLSVSRLFGRGVIPRPKSKLTTVLSEESCKKLLELPEVKAEVLKLRENRPNGIGGGILEVSYVKVN